MFREVEHALDGRPETELSRLSQRDTLAQRDADFPRRAHGAETAGEQQQLTPRVDQQRNLVIDLLNKVIAVFEPHLLT